MNYCMTSFRLDKDDKNRFILYDKEVRVEDKEYFNKSTLFIDCIRGKECEEYMFNPINDKDIILFKVCYQIKNYFGDKSGFHFESKKYIVMDDIVYKEDEGKIKRIPKEIKGIIYDFIER